MAQTIQFLWNCDLPRVLKFTLLLQMELNVIPLSNLNEPSYRSPFKVNVLKNYFTTCVVSFYGLVCPSQENGQSYTLYLSKSCETKFSFLPDQLQAFWMTLINNLISVNSIYYCKLITLKLAHFQQIPTRYHIIMLQPASWCSKMNPTWIHSHQSAHTLQ